MFPLACLQTNNLRSIQWLNKELVRLSEAQTSCQGSSGSLNGNFMLRSDILWLNLNGFPEEVIYFFERKAVLSRLQPGTSFVIVLSAHPGVRCADPASRSKDGSVFSVYFWDSEELVGCLPGRWGLLQLNGIWQWTCSHSLELCTCSAVLLPASVNSGPQTPSPAFWKLRFLHWLKISFK